MLRTKSLANYAWMTLAFTVGVILWGALVRATGSGAGCGSHWPTCHGEIVPLDPAVDTLIEFIHRATSGVAMLLVVGLLVWAFRAYPKGSQVRLGASLSMFFMVIEALIGAGLVLFGWVGDDTSRYRALVVSLHLANTFLLLGALTLTAWWASGGKRIGFQGQGVILWGLGLGLLGVLVIGMTGAITALGDTLFPAGSLTEGILQDLDPTSHFLIRLRFWHPVIAITMGFYLFFLSGLIGLFTTSSSVKRFAGAVAALFFVQLVAGVVNLLLLAPLWMQILHLFLADLVWISLVLLAASTLSAQAGEPVRASSIRRIAAGD